jgi:hypothetical protein
MTPKAAGSTTTEGLRLVCLRFSTAIGAPSSRDVRASIASEAAPWNAAP